MDVIAYIEDSYLNYGKCFCEVGELHKKPYGYCLYYKGGSRVFPLRGRRAEFHLRGESEPFLIVESTDAQAETHSH